MDDFIYANPFRMFVQPRGGGRRAFAAPQQNRPQFRDPGFYRTPEELGILPAPQSGGGAMPTWVNPGINPGWGIMPPRAADYITLPDGSQAVRSIARYGRVEDPRLAGMSAWERELYGRSPFPR